MNTQNRILSAVLVLQLALAAFVLWPRPTAATENELLLSDLNLDSITSISIENNAGNSIKMSKLEDGWVLPDSGNFPCKLDAISGLLEKLAAMNTSALVTKTPSSQDRLKVAEDSFETRIELGNTEAENIVLYFGTSPSYSSIHVRRSDQDETYLVRDISSYELSPTFSSWIDASYITVTQDDVTTFTIENGNGKFVFDKHAEGEWKMPNSPADRELDSSKVSNLLGRVANLQIVKPLGTEEEAAYGLDQPSAVVSLRIEGNTIVLQIGSQDPETNNYIVSSSESPYFVEVSEFSVQEFVENDIEGFLLAEPTPQASEGE
jgi:hypothetical protein